MDEELPEPVLEIDEDLPEPILLEEDSENPGSYNFNPPIKANLKLKIKKDDPVRKCKLNSKKIYKIYEDEQKLKAQVDVLKAAIGEIKAGKSVSFNKNAGLKRIESASATLNLTKDESASLVTQWNWFVVNRKNKGSAEFKGEESDFFGELTSKRRKLKNSKFGGAQVLDWIKHSAPPILEVICEVADSEVDALFLWANAYQEGISNYVLDSTNTHGRIPTKMELNSVVVNKEVDGYLYLGLDDFWLDYTNKKYPLKDFLPNNYEINKVKENVTINDDPYNPREVVSATFDNMKLALQALKANIKRRIKIMLGDMEHYGYKLPKKGEDEYVYWYFNYSNAGAGAGRRSLKEYKNKRKLNKWIKLKKYRNSLQFLDSYKLAKELGLFQ